MAAKELTSRLEIANWVTGPLTVQQRTTVYIVLPAISDTSEEDEKDVGIIYSYALFFFFSFFNSVVQTVQQGRSATLTRYSLTVSCPVVSRSVSSEAQPETVPQGRWPSSAC